MKTYIPYSLLLAAAATGMAFGANTAYTTPVGYESVSLPAGREYNVTGIRLQGSTVASGKLTGVDAAKVSTSLNFDTLLTAGRTYVLEIKTGTMAGLIQEVVAWGTASGNAAGDLSAANLAALGVAVDNEFTVRLAPTLEELFAGSTVLNGFTAAQADIIWIPNGTGDYNKYYRSSLTGTPWKSAANNQNTPNVPVVYQDGIIVQKRASSPASSLVVVGEVKKTSTISPLLAGTGASPSYNLLSTVYPAGSTLQNSGIKPSLAPGFAATQADIVWVPNSAGDYDKYYVSSLTGNPWKNVSNNANVTTDIELPGGVLIERKGAAVNVTLTPPPSYSGL